MTKISVDLENSYDIYIGRDIINSTLDNNFIDTNIKKVLIISDDIVAPLYLDKITKIIEKHSLKVYNKIIINGEKSKSFENYIDIQKFLAKNNFTRSDLIVALGGGVVGDLSGFCASTYLRGIKYVQIPTTLLAVIDSSVGGKTAINLPIGKNLVGSFYQPDMVVAELSFLDSLPDLQWQNGKGELIKYTLLSQTNLLELCEESIQKNLKKIIKLCVIYKRNIVIQDEKENNIRTLLNLGHTLGHAIEKMSNFTILHGIAVAMGIKFMVDDAYSKGHLEKSELDRIYNLLKNENLLIDCPYKLIDILKNIENDKKIKGDYITIVAIKKLKICHLEKVKINDIKDYFLLL